ncbi:type I-B CRISPR-associated protein Cas7/Csh2 [Syntrophomonas wolfei]|uniref:CRISPR-associated protein, Csh2 family n=1 Tax=Syntrophomonas wolfei subsp. wolfei (strain DSM 2245B / Goettingen) TaxID=335541 RepID=Q0ATZ6_SYNWW|nr:type I-B CRISPR-associated protein Cas7/Csh2 [Syntrophomonas wolfei]ABI69808.1 CRISPR-associated protein, Csh2 family [Syntrophomonas wolfei subsp. wolfei str. Goettingen G311]
MAFKQRREYLFLYTVKDANPNGDPLNENHPRYDGDTAQAMASDVRVKRTTRDEWVRSGEIVFVDGEPKSLKTRFEELKKITGKSDAREIMKQCLDVRLFGVTFALGKEAFAWTGPVQFKWGRSLHSASFEFVQGTAAFATERGGADNRQRSFRNEYLVPFALMGVYAIANQYASQYTDAADEDLQRMLDGLWQGTDNLITRSKNEHKSRLLIEITYKEDFNGKIGALDDKVTLLDREGKVMDREKQKALRSLQEVSLDIGALLKSMELKQEQIAGIRVITDGEINIIQEEQLKGISSIEVR